MDKRQTIFAQCRSLGHEWQHSASKEVHAWGLVLRSICADCGMERIKEFPRSGELGRSRYIPPEGYSQHGEERLPLHEWRSLFVVQFMPTKQTNGRKQQ